MSSNFNALSKKKKRLFVVAAIVCALLLIEIALHIVSALSGSYDPRHDFSSYKGKEWAPQMFKDYSGIDALGPKYFKPYIEWQEREYHSTYVNIESDGRRKTWNPDFAHGGAAPKKVYVFGGSTAFSVGSRDDYTVPSDISRELNASSSRYLVYNYGQGGYAFGQEIQRLIMLLKAGVRPDYVIFYNGGNNVVAAYDAGAAGAITQEPGLRQQLESTDLGKFSYSLKAMIRDYCQTCRGVINLGRLFSVGNFRLYPIASIGYSDQQIAQLSRAVADDYRASTQLVDALSRAYNFKYLFFWQPSLLGEDHLVGDEQKLPAFDWRLQTPNQSELYRLTTKNLHDQPPANFFDLSDVLRSRTQQMYLDHVHVDEEGNAIIASHIADEFKKAFPRP